MLATLLLAVATAAPPPLTRDAATAIVAGANKIVSPNGIEKLVAIQIDGTTQWLSIRGTNLANPILLFLHGGPGSPEMPIDWTFQRPWEDYFTVVQWDQRGAGKTYAANDPKTVGPTMTAERMTSDAEAIVRYLQTTYHKPKIFLLGHSWGSVLGVNLAQRHPDWFYAYVGVGQMVNMRKSEELGYAFDVAQAAGSHNAAAQQELAAIAPYPGDAPMTFARIGVQRKWLNFFGGLAYGRSSFDFEDGARKLSPDYTQAELDRIDAGGLFSLEHLLPQVMAMNFDRTTTFGCPIVMFVGRHDYAVNHDVTADWFATIAAPSKKLVWFEDSAHLPMQEEPGRFLVRLVSDVLPYASPGKGASPSSAQ
jgi:pimeloyl-ACP methyl ester carboxylesterase